MVDVLFVESRKFFDISKLQLERLDNLPDGQIGLAGTVQYLELLEIVKKYLENKGREVVIKQGAFYDGHVVGCQPQAFDNDCAVLLLLCDGKFHAMNNAIILKRGMFIFNGEELLEIKDVEIDKYYKKLKNKQTKFLVNEKVGLLVSTKIGQRSLNYLNVKEKIESMGKKVYVFESDNIDINEFINFNDVKIFVNTSCFGLAMDDNSIINLADVVEFFN